MQIESLISASRTLCGVEGGSKKRALELLANAIAQDIPAIDAVASSVARCDHSINDGCAFFLCV